MRLKLTLVATIIALVTALVVLISEGVKLYRELATPIVVVVTATVPSTQVAIQSSPMSLPPTSTPAPIINTPTNAPMRIPPATTLARTPTTSPHTGKVLFTDDFESGRADRWRVIEGKWEVITDETGNHVYSGTGSTLWGYAVAGDNDWKDYVLEARVKGVAPSGTPIAETVWAILTTRTNWGATCFGNKVQLSYSNGSLMCRKSASGVI